MIYNAQLNVEGKAQAGLLLGAARLLMRAFGVTHV